VAWPADAIQMKCATGKLKDLWAIVTTVTPAQAGVQKKHN